MENYFTEFYEVLRENLQTYDETYDEFINNGPELFKLLTEILNKKRIDPIIRLKISAAIAYFVAPYDVISEQLYGPMGYIDDIFISVFVLKDIEDDLGLGYLQNMWHGDEELKNVIDECYNKSVEYLGDRTDDIITYVGLDYIIED
ncbi:DUF1232 domain-containing protein [Methanobacterium sp. YSL]|nr:DUF1232 domain-containing protein [Methanobacterium sp. YSL]